MKKIKIRNFLVGGILTGVLLGCMSVFSPVTASNVVTVSSGALLEYLRGQQSFVGTSFNASYQRVYDIFQKTGMTLLKTVDYQSLVCLGVLPSESLFSQLQIDKMNAKISFSKDFIELENKITALEEKYRLQQEHTLDLFNSSYYDEEKKEIKADIDRIVGLHTGFIKTFESGYKTKILKFVSDYAQYLGQNKDLLQTINAKISKVQYLLNQEAKIESGISTIYANLQIQDIMNKIPLIQSSLQQVLLSNIDPYITTQVKKFKVLTTLSGELVSLKDATLQQYFTERDAYITKVLSPRYDYAQYQKTRQQLQTIKQQYYSGNILQCTQILSSSQNTSQEALLTEINRTINRIASGVVISKTSTSLKNTLLSGLQTFLSVNTSQKILSFKKSAGSLISQITKSNQSSSPVINKPTITGNSQSTTGTKINLPVGFVFAKPFTLNQRHTDIAILQQFLSNQGYYTGAIDSIYSQSTKNAVYAFQLAKGILKSTDRKDLQGYFGPATRAKVNALLK